MEELHIWRVRGRGFWASVRSTSPAYVDALGRVVGNECLDISNLMWVVWNLSKRFAKDLMFWERICFWWSSEGHGGSERGFSPKRVRVKQTGVLGISVTPGMSFFWSVSLSRRHCIRKHSVHQRQPTLATGHLIQRFKAFSFPTVKASAPFQGQHVPFPFTLWLDWALSAGTHREQLCPCVSALKVTNTSLSVHPWEVVTMAAKATSHPWQQQR